MSWNSYIFIQENALENVICEMASILFRPKCINAENIPCHDVIMFWFHWSCLDACYPPTLQQRAYPVHRDPINQLRPNLPCFGLSVHLISVASSNLVFRWQVASRLGFNCSFNDSTPTWVNVFVSLFRKHQTLRNWLYILWSNWCCNTCLLCICALHTSEFLKYSILKSMLVHTGFTPGFGLAGSTDASHSEAIPKYLVKLHRHNHRFFLVIQTPGCPFYLLSTIRRGFKVSCQAMSVIFENESFQCSVV